MTGVGREMLVAVVNLRRKHGIKISNLVLTPTRLCNGKLSQHLCCTSCLRVIAKTWDHSDSCEHFVDEPLNKFLKEGLEDGR